MVKKTGERRRAELGGGGVDGRPSRQNRGQPGSEVREQTKPKLANRSRLAVTERGRHAV